MPSALGLYTHEGGDNIRDLSSLGLELGASVIF